MARFRAMTLVTAFVTALVTSLLAAPLSAWAQEAVPVTQERSIHLVLLSFGKGDESTLRLLKDALASTGQQVISQATG